MRQGRCWLHTVKTTYWSQGQFVGTPLKTPQGATPPAATLSPLAITRDMALSTLRFSLTMRASGITTIGEATLRWEVPANQVRSWGRQTSFLAQSRVLPG